MTAKYDTLDSIEVHHGATLHDLYTWVLGLPMAQAGVCGVLTTGSVRYTQAQEDAWGRFVRFQTHREAWAVRSAPAGRIGQPLQNGELRKVAVLVRDSPRSTRARVTLIKLWRGPPNLALLHQERDGRRDERGARTHGPIGVAIHAVHFFQDKVVQMCESALSAVATVFRDNQGIICRVEASLTPQYVLCGAISGYVIPGVPKTIPCEEKHTLQTWEKTNQTFACLVKSMVSDGDNTEAAMLLFSAESVLEQCSFIGYLDMLADPFYEGALPDHAHQPNGIPLMMAIAIRIACNPSKWNLPPTRTEDAYATREANFLIEACVPSLAAEGADGVSGAQSFAIDMVIGRALEEMLSLIHKMQSGKLDASRIDRDPAKMDQVSRETLTFLYCTGIALCQDVCGLDPQQKDGTSGLHTSAGFAQLLADPVLESRTKAAYGARMGQVLPQWPTIRTSTKGKRQIALARVLVSVDQWLKTRKYRGVLLAETAQAPDSVLPQELDPTAAASSSSTTELLGASVGAPRSSKKKKKHVEALLADRGKMRELSAQFCANMARASLVGDKHDPRLVECTEKLSAEAVTQASGAFADVLQLGGCAGIEKLFEVKSYLVTPRSVMRCGSCRRNFVNVVESVAFAGVLGACRECAHPRCLGCVSRDIFNADEEEGARPVLVCGYCLGSDDDEY